MDVVKPNQAFAAAVSSFLTVTIGNPAGDRGDDKFWFR